MQKAQVMSPLKCFVGPVSCLWVMPQVNGHDPGVIALNIHIYVYIYVCVHVCVCVTPLFYMWHDSFACVTWLVHMCDMTWDMTHSHVWHGSFTCVAWLIHMCDIPHSYERHDLLMCVAWLVHMCDMTYSYVWHDSFIGVTWLIHMCDMTHRCYTWVTPVYTSLKEIYIYTYIHIYIPLRDWLTGNMKESLKGMCICIAL